MAFFRGAINVVLVVLSAMRFAYNVVLMQEQRKSTARVVRSRNVTFLEGWPWLSPSLISRPRFNDSRSENGKTGLFNDVEPIEPATTSVAGSLNSRRWRWESTPSKHGESISSN